MKSELILEYEELAEALRELYEIEDDEFRIDANVYMSACFYASQLMLISFPVPKVFCHGPKSVVFNWEDGTDSLYLTISCNLISVLKTNSEQILRFS